MSQHSSCPISKADREIMIVSSINCPESCPDCFSCPLSGWQESLRNNLKAAQTGEMRVGLVDWSKENSRKRLDDLSA